MNKELLIILSENPQYKQAYNEFLEIHKNNRGKDETPEQLAEFEEYYARDFLKGIQKDSAEREELIRGNGLVIRKARIEDADWMYATELAEENVLWVGSWPLGWRIAKFGDEDFWQTIIEKEDGTPIGFMIFHDMISAETQLELKRIVITEKGKGYGKAALHLAQKLAFEVFGTKYFYLTTKKSNLRAQGIYKATGFIPDMPDPCTKFYITDKEWKLHNPMQILYGTTNQAKLESMKKRTESLGVEIISLNDLNKPLPHINEDGKDPLENARIKAKAYYEAFGMPVFSCDSGLYFDELEDSQQPGTYIRRVNGKELTDEEMITYYADLARKHNDRLVGRYRNAICFIVDENTVFESMDDALATEAFLLISEPHEKRNPGFPLDSLSVDIASGKYYYDLTDRSVDKSAVEWGFRRFFEEVLSRIREKT